LNCTIGRSGEGGREEDYEKVILSCGKRGEQGQKKKREKGGRKKKKIKRQEVKLVGKEGATITGTQHEGSTTCEGGFCLCGQGRKSRERGGWEGRPTQRLKQ